MLKSPIPQRWENWKWSEKGPDLRGGRGPGLHASHRQRASHQILHILFLANLRNYDLVLMHTCVKHASARLVSFIDQFIASLDQRLQAKLLAGRFGCFGCLSTLSSEELLTAAKTLVESFPTQMISTIHLFTIYVTLPSIFKARKHQHWAIFEQTTYSVIPLHWQIFIGHRPKNIGHHIKI